MRLFTARRPKKRSLSLPNVLISNSKRAVPPPSRDHSSSLRPKEEIAANEWKLERKRRKKERREADKVARAKERELRDRRSAELRRCRALFEQMEARESRKRQAEMNRIQERKRLAAANMAVRNRLRRALTGWRSAVVAAAKEKLRRQKKQQVDAQTKPSNSRRKKASESSPKAGKGATRPEQGGQPADDTSPGSDAPEKERGEQINFHSAGAAAGAREEAEQPAVTAKSLEAELAEYTESMMLTSLLDFEAVWFLKYIVEITVNMLVQYNAENAQKLIDGFVRVVHEFLRPVQKPLEVSLSKKAALAEQLAEFEVTEAVEACATIFARKNIYRMRVEDKSLTLIKSEHVKKTQIVFFKLAKMCKLVVSNCAHFLSGALAHHADAEKAGKQMFPVILKMWTREMNDDGVTTVLQNYPKLCGGWQRSRGLAIWVAVRRRREHNGKDFNDWMISSEQVPRFFWTSTRNKKQQQQPEDAELKQLLN